MASTKVLRIIDMCGTDARGPSSTDDVGELLINCSTFMLF